MEDSAELDDAMMVLSATPPSQQALVATPPAGGASDEDVQGVMEVVGATIDSLATCNGLTATGLLGAGSDVDLRMTKGELFSKLTERQPAQQQQQVSSSSPSNAMLNRPSSDENLASSKGLNNDLAAASCHAGGATNCSSVSATDAASHQLLAQKQQAEVAPPTGISNRQDSTTTSTSTATTTNNNNNNNNNNNCATTTTTTTNTTTTSTTTTSAPASQEAPLFARIRGQWYTNEEVANILTNYNDHPEWQSNELQMRPQSGAVLLYSREKVRYRQDGYCWKKRKNGRTTREDHMKLKVQGIECIYGCYVHSALLPTFHRRCYWLLENPDIVLVHYLNQPYDDKNKMILTFNSSLLEMDTKRRWTNQEIIEEIGAVFGGISQIQQTLSINFPSASDPDAIPLSVIATSAAVNQEKDELAQLISQDQPFTMNVATTATSSGLKPELTDSQRASSSNRPTGAGCGGGGDGDDDDEDGDNDDEDDEMQSIGQDNPRAKCMGDNQLQQPDEAMTFDIVIDQRQARSAEMAPTAAVASKLASATSLAGDDPVLTLYNDNDGMPAAVASNQAAKELLIDDIQDHGSERAPSLVQHVHDSVDGRPFCDHDKLIDGNTMASPLQHVGLAAAAAAADSANPCSPVTQIYNKIVDDIETYAIPFELDQFDPTHNHLHQHHHHHHSHHGSSEIQSMDTSEPDHDGSPKHELLGHQRSSATGGAGDQFGDHYNDTSDHHHHHHHGKPDCDPVQLIACDLFVSCGGLNGDSSVGADGTGETASNVIADEDGMGASSSVGELLACQDTSTDPLADLFSFKNHHHHHHNHHNHHHHNHHHLLDVKSTTSETDTLDRLSPIAAGRQPPRCNSSDDAMQLSAQRLDQYLHHTSIHFLDSASAAGATQQLGESDHNNHHHHHQLIDQYSDFRDEHLNLNHHHSNHQHQHHDQRANIMAMSAHRSATNTSTEPSNSTSTSSLLNATSGLGACSGVSYASGQSATDQGLPSSSLASSHYNESSVGSSSSFIKLPLPQRQNSEHKEPSNSVLSSLLPKALSLDGSDLSSAGQHGTKSNSHHRQHHHHHHHQQHHHLNHHHHQNNHLQHHHNHNHHHQRASPLVGPYHTTTRTAAPPRTYSQQQQQQQQQAGHMLLVPPTGQQQHSGRHLHYQQQQQRPSAPTISPTGYAGLDSSGKLSAPNGQFRSSSIANTPVGYQQQASLQQQQQQQQQAQNVVEYVRLLDSSVGSRASLLPILEYVPNWSPTSGGTKILLIGRWTSLLEEDGAAAIGRRKSTSALGSRDEPTLDQADQQPPETNPADTLQQESRFFVLFDDLLVPASLIQDNVLRCYSPYHEPGFIALKVLYKNLIVSEQVLFEICAQTSEPGGEMIGGAAKAPPALDGAQATATSAPSITGQSGNSLGYERPETSLAN